MRGWLVVTKLWDTGGIGDLLRNERYIRHPEDSVLRWVRVQYCCTGLWPISDVVLTDFLKEAGLGVQLCNCKSTAQQMGLVIQGKVTKAY